MSQVRVTVTGLDGLLRALARTRTGLAELDLSRFAAEGRRVAAAFAPRRSGALARSIRATWRGNRLVVVAGGPNVPYAAVVNYGSARRGIAGSHFMQDADRVLTRRAPAELDRAIGRVLARQRLI